MVVVVGVGVGVVVGVVIVGVVVVVGGVVVGGVVIVGGNGVVVVDCCHCRLLVPQTAICCKEDNRINYTTMAALGNEIIRL